MLLDLLPFRLAHPGLLIGIPIAAAILALLLARDFVKVLPEERRSYRRRRVWLFVSRLLLASLLLVALAGPYGETTKETSGNPRVTILLDTSGSMQYLDTSFAEGLADELGRHVSARLRRIGTPTTSDIGGSILQNLEPGGNILLISDGNANAGASLGDVAFYATTLNATVSVINLSATEQEAAVTLSGPAKVVADSEAEFTVTVSATRTEMQLPLTVSVDGAVILDRTVSPGSYAFTRRFTTGSHRIEARIGGKDAYPENDAFYKEVRVLPKPKVLLVSRKSSPLELLLRQLYDVQKQSTLPPDPSGYYAVILDDVPIETARNTQGLHDYLIDEKGDYYGNGLVLFGGLNSFDRGGYSGSSLEPLLPVRVGKGERKKGNANLIFIVDVSGSTTKTKYRVEGGQLSEYQETVPTLDVIKAQLVNAVEQLKLDNKVGIILFGIPPGGDSGSAEEAIGKSVVVMASLDYLYNNRKDILEKAPRILGGGPTAADIALRGAVEMLRNEQGDKNIILLTDGRYSAGLGADSPMKKELLTLASNARAKYGINFMTIGVGTADSAEFPKKVDEAFLKQLAASGDGTYDRATQLNSLLVKWGDPKAKEFGQEFILVPLSLTHFITKDIEPTAVLNAYNEVAPKDTAEILLAADSGQPALTVWRYGNGRVAVWSVFAGNNLGQLLNAENSLLISRTINWAIGDPQRKEAYYVDIPDARIGEQGTVTVRSESPVTSEALDFSKEGSLYTARFTPGAVGWGSLLGQEYAVNRPSEYDLVGMNPGIGDVAVASGGKIFKPSESDAMIEHIEESSRRVTVERQSLAPPFLWAAILLFLLELLLRRMTERRRR